MNKKVAVGVCAVSLLALTSVTAHARSEWTVVDTAGKAVANATVREGRGEVTFEYDRKGITVLKNNRLRLSGMKAIRIALQSKQAVPLVIGVADRDNAGFHALIQLKAGETVDTVIPVSQFQVNEDSPVKKSSVETEKLKPGFVLIDFGGQGQNSIRISKIEVRR